MKPEPKRQNVGKCPRCAFPIFADVDLSVVPGEPFLASDTGRWTASANVRIASVKVEHTCSDDDPPTAFEEAIGAVAAAAREAMGDA